MYIYLHWLRKYFLILKVFGDGYKVNVRNSVFYWLVTTLNIISRIYNTFYDNKIAFVLGYISELRTKFSYIQRICLWYFIMKYCVVNREHQLKSENYDINMQFCMFFFLIKKYSFLGNLVDGIYVSKCIKN